MKKNKISTMELIWFVLMLASFILFFVETFRKGIEQSYILLILGFISSLMFFWRRTLRKNEEKNKL